jgi:glyoxylase-like metal-dependent hydrolase (beta-lactamase superfamily II)
MRLWLLGSGSKGNALLVECGETRVLIDAGFSARRLGERLQQIGVAPQSIQALLLTHEHWDHVGGVASAGAALAVAGDATGGARCRGAATCSAARPRTRVEPGARFAVGAVGLEASARRTTRRSRVGFRGDVAAHREAGGGRDDLGR